MNAVQVSLADRVLYSNLLGAGTDIGEIHRIGEEIASFCDSKVRGNV